MFYTVIMHTQDAYYFLIAGISAIKKFVKIKKEATGMAASPTPNL
jgi:hypothetical protein